MILLVTNERDLTTDYIVRELERRRERYIRLNTERLSNTAVRFGVNSEKDWSISCDSWSIHGADVTAAYFRRPGQIEISEAITDAADRVYCAAEWAGVLKTLYGRLGQLWLNEPAAIALEHFPFSPVHIRRRRNSWRSPVE